MWVTDTLYLKSQAGVAVYQKDSAAVTATSRVVHLSFEAVLRSKLQIFGQVWVYVQPHPLTCLVLEQ